MTAPQQPPAIDTPLIAAHDATADQTQQPPAQEREDKPWPAEWDRPCPVCDAMEGTPCGNVVGRRLPTHPERFAPPSEADSGGEAVVTTQEDWDAAEGCVERACQGNPWTEVIARALAEQRAALAASSGVRGGDDQGLGGTTGCHCSQTGTKGGDDQARERLARWFADREVPGG